MNHFVDEEDCLRQDFDVHVVSDPVCDLDALCDRHRPQLLMFESGVYAGQRIIRNVHAHRDVPRIGFCNADAYCPTRSIFLSDMERWGVETFFTHSVAMPSYTPEIADRLFLWPNFVSPKRFAFDRSAKDVPVLLTGSRASHYPWRNAVSRILSERFLATVTPHFGWFDASATSKMVVGKSYVQQLSRAIFVPTCGSVARDVVRKHFEIPAAGACLLAERTPAVEAAGFVDMENCVFADEKDVLDKVTYLLDHPQELDRIVQAGQELVHRRHTMHARTQLADWLALDGQRRPGQSIVQTDPFGPLELATGLPADKPVRLDAESPQVALIRDGLADLHRKDLRAARAKLTRSNNWHFTAEAALGTALSQIREGRPYHALEWIWRIVDRELSMNALDPDPVEWAALIRAWLCAGRVGIARRYAALIPWVRHHELDRMRHLIDRLAGQPPRRLACRPARPSVHVVEPLSAEEWHEQLADDLRRCGQIRLAARASEGSGRDVFDDFATAEEGPADDFVQRELSRIAALRKSQKWRPGAFGLRVGMRIDGPPVRKLQPALMRWALKGLGVQPPEIVRESAMLAETANFGQIVLHGVSANSILVDAVLTGAARNPGVYFEDPVVAGADRSQPGMRLFFVVGTCEGLDAKSLMERAEVVIVDGRPGRRSRELISQLLTSERFVSLGSAAATILRKPAIETLIS